MKVAARTLKVRRPLIAVVTIIAGLSANAAANSTVTSARQARPFYDAVKLFCIDTDLNPKAIEDAIKKAGGKPHDPPGSGTQSPLPIAFKAWDITLSGHQFMVSASVVIPRNFPEQFGCTVRSFRNEDSSLAAIQNWILIPSEWKDTDFGYLAEQANGRQKGSLKSYSYVFQVLGQTHAPIRSNDEYMNAVSAWRVWGAHITRDLDYLEVTLSRDFPQRTLLK